MTPTTSTPDRAAIEGGERAGVGRGVHGRAAHAQVRGDRPEPDLEGGVDVDAQAQRGAVGLRGAGGELDLRDVVDHQRDGRGGDGVGREGVEGTGVDGRVAQQDVVDTLSDQPERLAQRVPHDTGEPGLREHPVEHVPHADGLAGHADRGPGGAPHEVGGVGVEGVEVHDGERRGKAVRRLVEAIAEGQAHASAPAVREASWCLTTPKRPAKTATAIARTAGTAKPQRRLDWLPITPTNTPPRTAPT